MLPLKPVTSDTSSSSSSASDTSSGDSDAQGTWKEKLGPELLSLDDDGIPILPKEWYDDLNDKDKSMKTFFAYVEKEETGFESLGLPFRRVIKGPEPCIQARQYAGHKDSLDTEEKNRLLFPGLKRPPLKLKAGKYSVLPSPRKTSTVDSRNINPPLNFVSDRWVTDDTKRFLERGLTLVTTTMPNASWDLGQLLGPNGEDLETIERSLSFAPPSSEHNNSEMRSATSTGHFISHPREFNIGLGWGDYDTHIHW
ncbi:unnamed protein product [Clonostachys rosea]|uniref:Uncharacterized protein n=1 Tax=Bionectria ochroleuca TaxID=29856 RepID=A0ABY6ULA6_BIOOC|nr:unnamed protein product [Clonostachys rosea]